MAIAFVMMWGIGMKCESGKCYPYRRNESVLKCATWHMNIRCFSRGAKAEHQCACQVRDRLRHGEVMYLSAVPPSPEPEFSPMFVILRIRSPIGKCSIETHRGRSAQSRPRPPPAG